MTIYIASDHAGFDLKEQIKAELKKQKKAATDLGTASKESTDYADYAEKLARNVAEKTENKGILICGTGIGMCIAANKVHRIRAALIYDDFSAKAAAEHNDSNVACFGGRTQKIQDVSRWIGIWMSTPFSSEERHHRRVEKIRKIEQAENRC